MMETFVAEAVVELLARHGSEDLIAREVDDQDLDAWLEDASKTIGVDLGDEQRAAVRMALLGRFGLLVGGAGVGKTTVLKAVVAASEHFGRAVHQMALAGRAAVRMTQATGRKAWTIAAFLNGVEARRIVVGPEALVVVDESSMLDLPTLYRILRAIPTSGRLLLVGDPAQLPPIGFGLTLHALVATPKMPKVELRTIRRQSTASGIPMVAAAVREGRVPKLAAFDIGVAGVSLLECRQEEVADRVVDVVAELGGIANARILSALKSGSSGTIALNTRFHRIVSAGHSAGNSRFRLGEPVVFLRNDYRRDLRNGSLGEGGRCRWAWRPDRLVRRCRAPPERSGPRSSGSRLCHHRAQGPGLRLRHGRDADRSFEASGSLVDLHGHDQGYRTGRPRRSRRSAA